MIRNISGISASNIIKIISIFSFILVDIGLIYAHESPATGYESSIYASTPLILWISISIALVCGISIIIYAIYKNLENKTTWLIGLVLVLFFYVISISIYLIRGYYMWITNGDPSTHILFVKEIINTGHIPDSLIYPITHVYTLELVKLTSIDLISLEKLIPVFFMLIFIVFVYVLAKSVFINKGPAILATLISCIFLPGSISYYPNFIANCFFPLILFILIKLLGEKKLTWMFISLLTILLYPVFHILPTFIAMVIIGTFLIATTGYRLFNNRYNPGQYFYGLLLIVLIIWSTIWITSFHIWDFTISSAYKLVAWGGTSYMSSLNSQVTQAQSSGYNVLEIILKQEGNFLLFVLIAIIIFPLAWKELRNNRIDVFLLTYASIFTIGASTVAMYFLNLGFGPLRLLFYILLLCGLFVGFALFTLIYKIRSYRSKALHYLTMGAILVVIFILFINGLSVFYPSPYDLQQNYQTTKQEVYGMGMLLDHRDLNFDIVNTNLAYWRFAHVLLSPEEITEQNIPVSVPATYSLATPYHFGYNNYTAFASAYPDDAYLLVTQRDRSVYTDIFPDMAKYRFTQDDFSKLPGDMSLYRIYSNGEFDTYDVYHS